MGTEEQFEFFELHICVKDYCFARDDRLVGVSVIALKDISEKVSRTTFTVIIAASSTLFE